MKIIDWSTYTFRCSSLGKIISKSGKMTQGIETYLHDVFISETEQIDNDINSKYFEKGLFEEESGITLLNQALYSKQFLIKNKERKTNEFINGECDLVSPDKIVYDIKNSWDTRTFHKASLTTDYDWQLVGYAWLWGIDKARLFYCLNNTPEHLIIAEEKRLFFNGGYYDMNNAEYLKECENLRKKHNHDDKQLAERFKMWDVEITEEKITTIQNAVNTARIYLTEMQEQRVAQIESNSKIMK